MGNIRKVTDEEFSALKYAKNWELYDGAAEVVEIRTRDGFESCAGIPLAFMRELEVLFETDNISIKTSFEGDYSDLTPGNGPDIWIEVVRR